jgi:5-methylcytosine-specific restriction endonuclease McrA
LNTHGHHWIRNTTRYRVYQRDGWRCVWCRVDLCRVDPQRRTLDHILVRARGGSNATSNLVTACLACNSRRGDKAAITFAYELAWDPPATTRRVASERAARILNRVIEAMGAELPKQVELPWVMVETGDGVEAHT